MNIARKLTALTGLAFLSVFSAACGMGADDKVHANVEVINHTKSALTAGGIASVNGTYSAACHGRASDGSDTWSVAVAQDALLDYDLLAVDKNDNDCVLKLTELKMSDDTILTAESGSPLAASPISMSTSYGSPKSFIDEALDQFHFYGNAKHNAADFSGNFTISIVVSDVPDTDDTASTNNGSFATVSASSVTASDVHAPDATLNVSSISYSLDSDDKVLSASGNVVVGTAGDYDATDWAVVAEADLVPAGSSLTFDEVDAAWNAASTKTTFGSYSIPASNFLSAGNDLTGGYSKWLILRRDEGGVPGYQAIKITFSPPSN